MATVKSRPSMSSRAEKSTKDAYYRKPDPSKYVRKTRDYDPRDDGHEVVETKYGKIDPWDPDTWPSTFRKALEREMQIRDILVGSKSELSPRAQFLKRIALEDHQNKLRKRVYLDPHILYLISDIHRLEKSGAFKWMPDAVMHYYASQSPTANMPFNTSHKVDPKVGIWTPKELIRMSLYIMKLYLMGIDPYTGRMMNKYLTVGLHTISSNKMVGAVETAADFLEEVESDDDFDFDVLEF